MSHSYQFDDPLSINSNLTITSNTQSPIQLLFFTDTATHFLLVKAGSSLTFKNIYLNLEQIKSKSFITTDTSENPNHSSIVLSNCQVEKINTSFFNAALSSVCDSIIVQNCRFLEGNGTVFNLQEEIDNKGYYNVEKFSITNCTFNNRQGALVSLLRSGKDESTLGPRFLFANNQIKNCTSDNTPLLSLRGVQFTHIENNVFTNCNQANTLIEYVDWVRAWHSLKNNKLIQSGRIKLNEYVKMY